MPSDEELLLEFLYACPVGLIECDAAGTIAMINPHAMQHLLPLAGDRDSGNLFAALERHAPDLRHIAAAFAPATGRICEGHRITVDLGGSRRRTDMPKVLACTIVKLGPDRLMVTLADISAQVAQERRLRQADAWFSALLDQVNDYAVVTVSLTGEVQTANRAFTQQTGHACEAALGRRLADVLGGEADGGIDLAMQFTQAARDGWHLFEGWQHRASGERYWCQRLVVARHDDDAAPVSGFSVVLRDVPHRGAVPDDLRRLLTCDHLTGAANRRHFSQMLDQARAGWEQAGRPAALVMLDLDHFKQVNDRHGHPVGDALLRRVTEACLALLPADGTFARLGGEEFGAILPQCDLPLAMARAESMREAVATACVDVAGGTLSTTASFGCATFAEAGGSVDALVSLADARLYAAKREGRNRVHCPDPLAA